MSELSGREIVVGYKKASTWRTPVAVGANDGLLLTELKLTTKKDIKKDDSMGQAWTQTANKGAETVEGSLTGYMRFVGLDLFIAQIMGAAGTPAQQGSTAAYANSYTLENNTTGLFGTLAYLKKSDVVWEYPSLKPTGFTLSGEMNDAVKLAIDCIVDRLVIDSTTNTTTTIASVTHRTISDRLIMGANDYFRMNDASGSALSSSDNIYPSKFEIKFTRPHKGYGQSGYVGVNEPGSDGFPTIQITLEFPRYDDVNAAYFEDWDDVTAKKLEISFIGDLIASTYYNTFTMKFPKLNVTSIEADPNGAGDQPCKVVLEALKASSAPSGMTGITLPMQVDVINVLTASPLA